MFERFTDRARRVLVLAQEEARLLNHNFIGTEHLLLGLIDEQDGIAARTLESLGIGLEAARRMVEETIGVVAAGSTASPPFTPRAKKVLELALREALQLGHDHIGTEHLLLGLVREGEGVGAQVLVDLGADLAEIRRRVIEMLDDPQPYPGEPGSRPGLIRTGRGGWIRPDRPGAQPLVGPRVSRRLWRRAATVRARANLDEPLRPEFALSGSVELTYQDGRLAGRVAGQTVDLSLDLPSSRGRAEGTFVGTTVSVAWNLADNNTWPEAVPASVHGTVAEEAAKLFAWFHLDPPLHFEHGTVEGEFAGEPISAYIDEGDQDGDTGTFAAFGIFAESSLPAGFGDLRL